MSENLQNKLQQKINYHQNATIYYQKINFFLNFISFLLGSIAALVGTILNNDTTVYIFLVVAHWIITTFNSFSQGFKLKTKEHKHFNCLKQYQCLKQEVDLYILENQIVDYNIQKFINEFNHINLNEPEKPICFRFNKDTKTRGISNV